MKIIHFFKITSYIILYILYAINIIQHNFPLNILIAKLPPPLPLMKWVVPEKNYTPSWRKLILQPPPPIWTPIHVLAQYLT